MREKHEDIIDEFLNKDLPPLECYHKMLNILAEMVMRITRIEKKLQYIGLDALVQKKAAMIGKFESGEK